MDDIAEQFALRDRFLDRRWRTLTPSQRLEEMDRLQRKAQSLHELSPRAHAEFLARNFKSRAIDHGESNVT